MSAFNRVNAVTAAMRSSGPVVPVNGAVSRSAIIDNHEKHATQLINDSMPLLQVSVLYAHKKSPCPPCVGERIY